MLEFKGLLGSMFWMVVIILVTGSTSLAKNTVVSLRRIRIRTNDCEVNQGCGNDNPIVHGINNITTIELEVG